MNNRRRAAVAGASVLGALALVGCNLDTKPSALVTVVSGSESKHTEARCQDIKPDAPDDVITTCVDPDAEGKDKPPVVKVSEGAEIGVGVEPSVAESSWRVVLGDEAEPVIEDKTYYSGLRVPHGTFENTETVPLAVVEYKDEQIHNVWLFSLEKK